jgi:hypothetical protein
MLKSIKIAVAIGAIATLFAVAASAQPLAAVKSQPAVASKLTLVRDGCGRGRHFSDRLDRCVDDVRVRIVSPKELCRQRCYARREECNLRRGGYFNGCGVQATACLASC